MSVSTQMFEDIFLRETVHDTLVIFVVVGGGWVSRFVAISCDAVPVGTFLPFFLRSFPAAGQKADVYAAAVTVLAEMAEPPSSCSQGGCVGGSTLLLLVLTRKRF